MLDKNYMDRLDEILLPECDVMESMPSGVVHAVSQNSQSQEIDVHRERTVDLPIDSESPAQIAKYVEKESERFIYL